MKKGILLIISSIAASSAFACNVCGGASGNQSLGLLPLTEKHFMSVHSQYRTYTSTHEDHHNPEKGDVHSEEKYTTLQVMGRYSLSSNWQLYAFLPYHINNSVHDDKNVVVKGIGDVSVLAAYQVISKEDCGPILKHNLQVSGGVKAPTGRYAPAVNGESANAAALQAGTKSWDFTGNINYSVRKERLGANVEASYMVTTANYASYKYGNKVSGALLGFYTMEKNGRVLLPMAGVRYEYTSADYVHYRKGWVNHSTGGHVMYGSVGVQSFFNHLGAMISFSVPLKQEIAGGTVRVNYKAEAGVQYLF